MRRIHLLRAGEFVDAHGAKVNLSDADIRDIVGGYDPARHEAPLVVGHPRSDKPAFGWVDKLEAGRGGLFGVPKQVSSEFSEAVREGRYKKVSASLYGPDNPRNTNPGKWSLRHVGFLGAQPPAVSGLQSVQFAEDDEPDLTVEIDLADDGMTSWGWRSLASLFQGMREWIIGEKDLETADRVMPSYAIDELERVAAKAETNERKETTYMSDPTNNPPNPSVADLAERERALVADRAALDEEKRRLAAQKAERRTQAAVDFAEKMASEGRILPREQKAVTGILTLLSDADANTVEFAEGDGEATDVPADEAFRSILSALPTRVDFSERAGGPLPDPAGASKTFKAPPGYDVDQNSLAVHNKVMDLCERENIDYDTALTQVTRSAA